LGTKEEEVEMGVTHVPPGEGCSLWVLGELVTYKTPSEQTGGAYSLFEVTTQHDNLTDAADNEKNREYVMRWWETSNFTSPSAELEQYPNDFSR
jgi:hypothetical protein